MITRRNFLNSAITAAAVERFSHLQALAAGEDYRALVCVFLFGGNDCNNTVVPMSAQAYQGYQTARGGLALAQNTLLPVAASGGASYGLHPRLGDAAVVHAEEAAIAANVGMLVKPTTRDSTGSAPCLCPSTCSRTPISNRNGSARSPTAAPATGGPDAPPTAWRR